MTTTESAYLSVAEVAQTLGLSKLTIYRRIWHGSLPALRLSERGAVRIPASVLEELAHTSEAPVRAPRTGPEPAVEAPAHDGGDRKEEA
jgi:excisionase family DNA binding protein